MEKNLNLSVYDDNEDIGLGKDRHRSQMTLI